MHIFIPTAIFHPDSGGPATYLYRFLPELVARGHTIHVLTFGEGDTEGYGYPVTRVSLRQGLLKRRGEYQRQYRALMQGADLIYVNNLGLPRPDTPKTPTVLKVVGDFAWERTVNRGWVPPDTDIDRFQKKRQSFLVEYLKWRRAREVQTVDRIIVPSDYLRRMVIGWGAKPEKVQVIYNALETDHTTLALSRMDARRMLGLSPVSHYLFTAARLTAWKGVDYLIRAMAELRAEMPELHLLIAGDGPQNDALQTLARQLGAENVTFLGKLPREQIEMTMRAADYFALYSGYEGLAHVLLEALNVGTPVIASVRGGNPEVVQDGVNGLLVKHPNQAALTEAIRRAFAPGVRDHLAANSTSGLDKFSWPSLVAQTITTLERFVEKPA